MPNEKNREAHGKVQPRSVGQMVISKREKRGGGEETKGPRLHVRGNSRVGVTRLKKKKKVGAGGWWVKGGEKNSQFHEIFRLETMASQIL